MIVFTVPFVTEKIDFKIKVSLFYYTTVNVKLLLNVYKTLLWKQCLFMVTVPLINFSWKKQ